MGREKSRGKVKIFAKVFDEGGAEPASEASGGGANAETCRRTGTVRRRTESPTIHRPEEPRRNPDE